LLLLFSVGFYLTWSAVYTALLFAVTFLVWSLALLLERTTAQRKRWLLLVAGLCVPLGLLLFFKAVGPLDVALHALAHGLLGDYSFRLSDLAIPVGISFYTFKLLSYLLDVYWERATA